MRTNKWTYLAALGASSILTQGCSTSNTVSASDGKAQPKLAKQSVPPFKQDLEKLASLFLHPEIDSPIVVGDGSVSVTYGGGDFHFHNGQPFVQDSDFFVMDLKVTKGFVSVSPAGTVLPINLSKASSWTLTLPDTIVLKSTDNNKVDIAIPKDYDSGAVVNPDGTTSSYLRQPNDSLRGARLVVTGTGAGTYDLVCSNGCQIWIDYCHDHDCGSH